VFLGVVFSLGSTSVVSNTVSGIVLTYMRALRVGDRVKIGEVTGDVLERSLLAIKVRTVQNEIVTIPNGLLQSSTITNYSMQAASGQLILRANLTIGYDAPWPRVHEALLEAARRTPLVLSDPPPFVLQTALNDYNVAYSLNVFTREAQRIQFIESDLRQRIQDTFDEAEIEILSPMYNTIRQSVANDTLPQRTGEPGAERGA
jgi:small-conductance mechanosensitive channel